MSSSADGQTLVVELRRDVPVVVDQANANTIHIAIEPQPPRSRA